MSWTLNNTWAGGNIVNYNASPWSDELLNCLTSNSSACVLEVKSPRNPSISGEDCGNYTFSKINVTLQVYDEVL